MTADATLHTRLLDATAPFVAGMILNTAAVNAPLAALRAVVERHKPIPCTWARCGSPDAHRTCQACGAYVNHPCPELELIADQLGLTEGA